MFIAVRTGLRPIMPHNAKKFQVAENAPFANNLWHSPIPHNIKTGGNNRVQIRVHPL